jgi:hypothetical protein
MGKSHKKALMDTLSATILMLIILLAMHLVEEVKTDFRKKMLIREIPRPLFIGINIFLYTFCFTTLFLSIRGHASAIPLTWIFAIAMLLNGAGHIGIMVVRRSYFPGGLTGFLLLPASIYLIEQLIQR